MGDSPPVLGPRQAAHPLLSEAWDVPPPGLKTNIIMHLKKSPSRLLLTLAVRSQASTKCCTQRSAFQACSLLTEQPLAWWGLFFYVFLMRKYVRDYWHHRFVPVWRFSPLTNCTLCDLFPIFLSQYGTHLINLSWDACSKYTLIFFFLYHFYSWTLSYLCRI